MGFRVNCGLFRVKGVGDLVEDLALSHFDATGI